MSFVSYESRKDSGSAWLGEIPSHWKVVQSRRLFLERKERARLGDEQLTASQKYGILTQKEFSDREGQKVMQVISGQDILKHVEPNDFVISMRSFQGGLERSSVAGCISSAYVMIVPTSKCRASYYQYLFKSSSYIKALQSTSNLVRDGQALRYENFAQLSLPSPPEEEQDAIAAFLDRETAKIDALVEEQRRLIVLLKEKRQAVISHAVTKGLNPDTPMKDSGIEWLGEVPAHWEVKRIRFLCHIGTGDADTADAVEDGEYPFFVRSPIIERIGSFTHDCEAVLTAGDGAGVGKVYHHYEGQFRAHQRVYIFSKFRGIRGRFFYHYMAQMFAKVVLEGTAKSTVDSLRRPMIADFWMTVPPDVEQFAVIAAAEAASERFDALATEADAAVKLLEERRAALISAAVTGKIDVRGSAEILRLPVVRASSRGLIAVEIVERSAHQSTFGRVKLQKLAYLAEAYAGVSELEGAYLREAAGPLDREMISEMEREASALVGVRVEQPDGIGSAVTYRLGDRRGVYRQDLIALLGDRAAKFDKLVEDIGTIDTKGAEAVATLYAVWNDALIDGDTPADMEIKLAVVSEWHPEKAKKFRLDELQIWLDWMRRHGLVPTGTGPKTSTGRLFA